VSAMSSWTSDRPAPFSPEDSQRARGCWLDRPVPAKPRGRSGRWRCERHRRPGTPGVGDGTAAGPARALAHPGGGEAPPPVGFVHGWFVPGPEGTFTPISRIPSLGLDVEPSLITNFMGFTAFTVLAGQAEGSDGKTYDVRSDLRVMAGEYVAGDGSRHQGTFAFF
jgi:hypothetical protein